jgi:hypothetical protein
LILLTLSLGERGRSEANKKASGKSNDPEKALIHPP